MHHLNTKDIGDDSKYGHNWKGIYAPTAGEVAALTSKYMVSPILWAHGRRLGENFRLAEWLALDIDHGMPLDEGIKIFERYIHVIGTTKSHQKDKKGVTCDRFRVFIRLTDQCRSRVDYEATTRAWIKKYGADTSCTDSARMYAPCKIVVCKGHGKTVDIVDGAALAAAERKKAKRIAIHEAKMREAYGPAGMLPGNIQLMLDTGVSGSRTNAAFKVACCLKRVGYMKDEAFTKIWGSAIPRDNDSECRKNVQEQVDSAWKKA